MKRRAFIQSAIAASSGRALLTAQPAPIRYRPYARCLPDFLRSLAADAYKRRQASIAHMPVKQRQAWARETFLKLIGDFPQRTPLNTKTTGGFERANYKVEKILYQSRPDYWIAANLYIPNNAAPPFPGVLFQMGHSVNGKASDTYQRCCQGLVQLGYLVLAFDPMGQGERINYGGISPDEEHTVPGRQLLLVGQSASQSLLWDAMRSLDVLIDHPLVDRTRIASSGQSGGATLTQLLIAADDRLTCAALTSGNTENFACANFLPPGSVDDAEQDFINSGPAAFDRWDTLWPFAPKPLLIGVSARDWFGTYGPNYEEDGLPEFAALQKVYRTLGAADRVQRFETPLPHGLSYSLRLGIYNWFEKWMKNSSKRIETEPPVQVEADEVLWAAPNGKVPGKKPITLIRESIPETRSTKPDLAKLLQLDHRTSTWRTLGKVPSGQCDILAIEAQSAGNVWVPAWVFEPRVPVKKTLLILNPQGRNIDWHEGELHQELAAQGVRVITPDLRGIGDTRPEYSSGSPAYVGRRENEEHYALASMMLGRCLLGQRVDDILALISSQQPLAIAARGSMTIPALCAAAVDSRVQSLYLANHLVSWRSIAETERYTHPTASFVPDILRHTDLPEIAASLAPRRVVIAGCVDAAGKPAAHPGSPNLDARPAEAWNEAILSAI